MRFSFRRGQDDSLGLSFDNDYVVFKDGASVGFYKNLPDAQKNLEEESYISYFRKDGCVEIKCHFCGEQFAKCKCENR